MKTAMKLIATALLLFCASASAQSTYPLNNTVLHPELGSFLPYRGTYYDPHQGGTGLQVDIGASGFAFITYYTYDQAGNPSWFIDSGYYQPSDEATRWTTGVIGTLSGGPFYQAFGGQCLGCDFKPTNKTLASNFMPTLTWVNTREVLMTVGTHNWDFVAPNLDFGVDGDYLKTASGQPSVWATDISFNFDGKYPGAYQVSAVVLLTPNTKPVAVKAGFENMTNMPSTAVTYVGACEVTPTGVNTLCKNFTASLADGPGTGGTPNINSGKTPATAIFWFDQEHNRFGMDAAVLQTVNGKSTYVIGPTNIHYDLYLDGTNHLVGRGTVLGKQLSVSPYKDGGSEFAISMTKLPNRALGP